MNWLPYPKHKPDNIQHCLVSVSFIGGDGKRYADVWSAIYTTHNGFRQLQPKDGGEALVPLSEIGVRDLHIQGFIPYPPPMQVPRKMTTYDLLD